MSIIGKVTGYFRTSSVSLQPSKQESEQQEVQHPKTNEEKWPKHPFYKRILSHRYKLVLLPFLSFCIPVSESKKEEGPIPQIVKPQEDVSQNKKREIGPIVEELRILSPIGTLFILTFLLSIDQVCIGRKYIAVHELGHFLSALAIQSPVKPRSVFAGKDSGYVQCTTDEDYRISGVEELINIRYKKLIFSRGAERMEKLVYGHHSSAGIFNDKIDEHVDMVKLGLFILKHKPKLLYNFLLFRCKLGKYTEKLLKQIDPEVVNTLVEKLNRDLKWNQADIEQIIKKFSLDKLTPIEEIIPEFKKLAVT